MHTLINAICYIYIYIYINFYIFCYIYICYIYIYFVACRTHCIRPSTVLHFNMSYLDSGRTYFLIEFDQRMQGKLCWVEIGRTSKVFIVFLMNGNAEFFKRNLSHGKIDHLWNWERTNTKGKMTEKTNPLGSF